MNCLILKRKIMKLVFEIFDEIGSTRSVLKKGEILRQHKRQGFMKILKHMFDKEIKYAVKKIPNYRPSAAPLGLEDTYLEKEMKDIHLFYSDTKLTDKRMEIVLIQILESVNHREAEILSKIIMGKMKVPGLTERLVREIYPDLLPLVEPEI